MPETPTARLTTCVLHALLPLMASSSSSSSSTSSTADSGQSGRVLLLIDVHLVALMIDLLQTKRAD